MNSRPRIFAFAGSSREGSLNFRLVRAAAAAAEAAGGEVTLADLRDFPMPLYDADLEARDGLPREAARLKEQIAAHDALLIASPEYNSSITPLLKNAIDWATRPRGPAEAFGGKAAGIMSASPGGLGGIRGLVHLRSILGNIGVLVLPQQVTVSAAHEAFDESGALADPGKRAQVTELATHLVRFAKALQTE